jgi:hypothetical protein
LAGQYLTRLGAKNRLRPHRSPYHTPPDWQSFALFRAVGRLLPGQGFEREADQGGHLSGVRLVETRHEVRCIENGYPRY